jgi:hypothetical protein
MARDPSMRTNGRRVSAATGSAHQIPKSALATSPAIAIHDGYPQSEDSEASALREALENWVAKLRFWFANHGTPKADTTNNAMPTRLVRGFVVPEKGKRRGSRHRQSHREEQSAGDESRLSARITGGNHSASSRRVGCHENVTGSGGKLMRTCEQKGNKGEKLTLTVHRNLLILLGNSRSGKLLVSKSSGC